MGLILEGGGRGRRGLERVVVGMRVVVVRRRRGMGMEIGSFIAALYVWDVCIFYICLQLRLGVLD